MASFQGKTGWKRPRKREKKKLSFRSVSTLRVIENSKKIAKKILKIKKNHCAFISHQNRLEKAEKERKKKIIVPLRSYPAGWRKLKKNSKKI